MKSEKAIALILLWCAVCLFPLVGVLASIAVFREDDAESRIICSVVAGFSFFASGLVAFIAATI